ncbi:MAG: radical SAM protein [Spirochaetaceae bacterium]|jgi:radical SAM superfamily enzyme YgiQ (UPF0313 family)|nr:radical SAM protein [Spirochaetaceae bacterium]
MDYIGNIFRPPSEAESLILQITVGCSHNKCTFCGNYRGEKFAIKSMDTIKRDIDEAARYQHLFDKVFLADGDALILPTAMLLEILGYIRQKCSNTGRVGVYANTKSILRKTPEELVQLRDAGIGIVYHGVESGSDEVLRRVKKGATAEQTIEAAARVTGAGVLLSQMVLLGIGGVELSDEHATATGKILSAMSPDYAAALTVMILPETELGRDAAAGRFVLPDKFGIIRELKEIIENFQAQRNCFFTSNHASNYLPIRARLPDQRNEVLGLINRVLKQGDESDLRPETLRAL